MRLPNPRAIAGRVEQWYNSKIKDWIMPKPSNSHARKKNSKIPRAERESGAEQQTPEYEEYLERYGLYGEGRPKLAPEEFDTLDDELLELLAVASARLSDDQIVRLQELEYLLIDS